MNLYKIVKFLGTLLNSNYLRPVIGLQYTLNTGSAHYHYITNVTSV